MDGKSHTALRRGELELEASLLGAELPRGLL